MKQALLLMLRQILEHRPSLCRDLFLRFFLAMRKLLLQICDGQDEKLNECLERFSSKFEGSELTNLLLPAEMSK